MGRQRHGRGTQNPQQSTAITEPIADRVREALAADSAAWAREHLADDVVGWLTTVAPDGRVQTSAISFLWDGATILFYSKARREPSSLARRR